MVAGGEPEDGARVGFGVLERFSAGSHGVLLEARPSSWVLIWLAGNRLWGRTARGVTR